jgi:hypothetical protein
MLPVRSQYGSGTVRRDFFDFGVPVTHRPRLRSFVRTTFTVHFGPGANARSRTSNPATSLARKPL